MAILVILKGLHWQKLKKLFRYKEMIRKSHCYLFIYMAFKKSILKNYQINRYLHFINFWKSLQDIQKQSWESKMRLCHNIHEISLSLTLLSISEEKTSLF